MAAAAELKLTDDVWGRRLVASGQLDLTAAPHLRELLATACRHPDGDLSVSLDGVTFCDSLIAGLLGGADNRLRRSGYRVRIVDAGPQTERVFHLGGLGHLLAVREASCA